MIHPQKPLKTFTEADWEEYYSDPLHFVDLFKDYQSLREDEERGVLSTSQAIRLKVVVNTITEKLA